MQAKSGTPRIQQGIEFDFDYLIKTPQDSPRVRNCAGGFDRGDLRTNFQYSQAKTRV